MQHRQNADQYFDQNISREVLEISTELEIDLALPRYRSNIHAGNVKDYFKQQLFIPYLDSLITSWTTRFSAHHTVPFKIAWLIPAHLEKLSRLQFSNAVYKISSMYPIENVSVAAMTRYDHWSTQRDNKPANVCDTMLETTFYPATKEALIIILVTLPSTTCSIERSFSTLRRVKTSLRKMENDRLSGLCMVSVHKDKIKQGKKQIIDRVISKFGEEKRRLQFLFQDVPCSSPLSLPFK